MADVPVPPPSPAPVPRARRPGARGRCCARRDRACSSSSRCTWSTSCASRSGGSSSRVPGDRPLGADQPAQPLDAAAGFAVLLVYLGLLPSRCSSALLIVPPIVREANQLADDVPGYVADVRDFIDEEQARCAASTATTGSRTKLAGAGARSCPTSSAGPPATLGDIGLSLVNSLFAALNILILSDLHGRRRPAVAGVGHPPAASRAPARACGASSTRCAAPSPATSAARCCRRSIAGVHDVRRPDPPGRAVRRAAGGRDVPLRPHPARRRDRGRGRRRARHGLQRLPDHDDHLGGVGDRLPAGREQPHPAADPEQGRQRRGLLRPGLRAVRRDAVRHRGRAAGHPRRGDRADRPGRVARLPPGAARRAGSRRPRARRPL